MNIVIGITENLFVCTVFDPTHHPPCFGPLLVGAEGRPQDGYYTLSLLVVLPYGLYFFQPGVVIFCVTCNQIYNNNNNNNNYYYYYYYYWLLYT